MRLKGVISPSTSAAGSGTQVLIAGLQHSRVTHVLRCRQTTALQLGQQRQHQLVRLPARRTVAHKHAARFKVSASAASAAQQPDETPVTAKGPLDKFKALLSPFSEPSTNKKLLALCGAQALSSVATLIHDTYLPLYLSEELKLSNTKVKLLQSSQGAQRRHHTTSIPNFACACRLAICKQWHSSCPMLPSLSVEHWQTYYHQHA